MASSRAALAATPSDAPLAAASSASVLASAGIGGSYDGTVGNVGVEGVINSDNFRLYSQLGLTAGLSGDAANVERDVYATLSADYFVDPNFVLSANIGADNWTQSNGDFSPSFRGAPRSNSSLTVLR